MNGDELPPGSTICGAYKILKKLGGGGMGTVYLAQDLNFPNIRRLVAVKEMRLTDPSLKDLILKIFEREANLLASLNHPAILRIYTRCEENNRIYLVMEFINGHDLETILEKTKELPIDRICEWAIELCDVLGYLHSQKPPVVFRDMKPANIMIDHRGRVKLIDFGIAKSIRMAGTSRELRRHTIIGTQGYAPPEQYQGKVTPLSDIYALGATLHHVLTRNDPRFERPCSFDERPIHDYNPKVPDQLVKIIEKALANDPKDRWQSAAEMKAALIADRQPEKPTVVGRWEFRAEGPIRGTPVSFDGLVFVGADDGNLYAVKLDSGEFAWKFKTDGPITFPVIDEDNKLVLFGSDDFTFYAVNARTRAIQWTHTTRDRIRSVPLVTHGRIFFGGDDGRLYALMSGNGRLLWEYDTGAEVRSRPVVTSDQIIVSNNAGNVTGLQLNGEARWAFRMKASAGTAPLADSANNVCYVGVGANMYALDATHGGRLWHYHTFDRIRSTPVLHNNWLYFGSDDGHLYALTAEGLQRRWRFNAGSPVLSSPVIRERIVYFANRDGVLFGLDALTGQGRWKYEIPGRIAGSPYLAPDDLLIGSLNGTLYALPLA